MEFFWKMRNFLLFLIFKNLPSGTIIPAFANIAAFGLGGTFLFGAMGKIFSFSIFPLALLLYRFLVLFLKIICIKIYKIKKKRPEGRKRQSRTFFN